MNYYIEGDAAKADQIKAAFEAKGFIPRIAPMYYGSESVLFFTGIDNYIYETSSPWVMDIIITHPDYKELELPVEPKFKVGDRIRWINHDVQEQTITDIKDDSYITVDKYGIKCALKFTKQDEWELVQPKPHYDIANFHAGMPVLVRDYFDEEWKYVQFSHMRKLTHALVFDAGCSDWYQCIPFNKDTEHLIGTTDMPSEEFINW